MIYQLLKTTPYLTGQVRLDLVADHLEGDSDITLDEVHVVPVNDSIWYNCPENQINFKHSENIVSLYRSIADEFYSSEGDTMLSGKYPYYVMDNIDLDTVDHTYQMGLRRIPRARYGKDFSFFMPMWISIDPGDMYEDPDSLIDNLEFYATVYPSDDIDFTNPLTTKKLVFSDRLKDYLKGYLYGVNSDLIYIGLRDGNAYINGMNVENGSTITKDISVMVKTLLDRERPIIETDNIISRKFMENKMIAKQIINFNICFSIGDLFSSSIIDTVMWNPINIVVSAKLKNGNERTSVQIKDLYTNYDTIYSYKINNIPTKEGYFISGLYRHDNEEDTDENDVCENDFNVLDYLSDNNCIDLIHKNKIVQPNTHWAFRDNLRYTWNLYNGFSPIVENESNPEDSYRIEGRFFGTPDIISPDYEVYKNNIQWMSVIDNIDLPVQPGHFVGMTTGVSGLTVFEPNQYGYCWSRGIKYNIGNILSKNLTYLGTEQYPAPTGIRANMYILNSAGSEYLSTDRLYAAVKRQREGDGFADYVSIFGLTNDVNNYEHIQDMTMPIIRKLCLEDHGDKMASEEEFNEVFGSIVNDDSIDFCELFVLNDGYQDTTPNISGESTKLSDELLNLFGRVLLTVEYPNIIRFDKTIYTSLAPAPSIDKLVKDGTMDVEYTKEIEYKKMDRNYSTYLFRYDGNIVPQLIDPVVEYDKEWISDEEYWKTSNNAAFNRVYRKTQWKNLTDNEKDIFNYISKQRYQPDYPSISYYYIEGENQDIKKPFIPDGYNGEICWFNNNLIYFVPRSFTVEKICTEDEMTYEGVRRLFFDEVAKHGYFSILNESDEPEDKLRLESIVNDYLWRMYRYTSNWEYASIDDIEHYDFKVTYYLS